MPGSYLIDAERCVVFSRAWGVLTDAEALSHAKTLKADSRLGPGFRQVIDFRDLSELQLTSTGMNRMARRNPFPLDARRAVVVSSDVAFGMARMYQILLEAGSEQFGIFRELGPALEWVGLDPATPWPSRDPDATFGDV